MLTNKTWNETVCSLHLSASSKGKELFVILSCQSPPNHQKAAPSSRCWAASGWQSCGISPVAWCKPPAEGEGSYTSLLLPPAQRVCFPSSTGLTETPAQTGVPCHRREREPECCALLHSSWQGSAPGRAPGCSLAPEGATSGPWGHLRALMTLTSTTWDLSALPLARGPHFSPACGCLSQPQWRWRTLVSSPAPAGPVPGLSPSPRPCLAVLGCVWPWCPSPGPILKEESWEVWN